MSFLRDNKLNWIQRLCLNVIKCGPIPKHVAIIMDGNRRYAQKTNVDKIVGHSKGFDKQTETHTWCTDLGIQELTVYAFSIENFKRSSDEVDAIMELARQKLQKLLDDMDNIMKNGVRIRIFGNLSLIPTDIRKLMAKAMSITRENKQFFLNLAFAYTGQEEITQAVRHTISGVTRGVISLDDVSEDLLSTCLYTHPSSFPDLLIRTSGEVRVSDFLLWQISASCIYFSKTLWPEFSLWDMLSAIITYQKSHASLSDLREKVHPKPLVDPRIADFLKEVYTCREQMLLK